MRIHDSNQRRRPLRIAAEILRDLPEILRALDALPGDALVSVSDVEVSDDLSYAKVFFTVLGECDERRIIEITRVLNSQKGAVRHEIAQRLPMRQHPEFRFIYDATPLRAARIEELLKQIHRESPGAAGDVS
ncbi:MAG: 30S ribosome-binding factor RbfA [bacterium]|nr:30S ribosome-binding factor RbfA [bacterium]